MARVNRVALVVGALIAVPLVVFLALGFRHNPEVIESPLIGKPAPEFVLRDFAGAPIDLASLRGKPVVLNFWASWCQPCVAEHPLLVAAARRYGGEVAFVGVVPSEDTAAAVERFTQRFGKWGPVYHDADGRVSIAYGVFKLPETYFVSSDGRIVSKVSGPLDERSLLTNLEAVL
jgi:cytochrome c biogenesis protein CcmG, thiol:disulfide interchange protein DsbE